MHGYELITELENRSDGRRLPCPAAIYPALVRMEEHGLVEAEEVDRDLRSPTDPESPFARSIGVDASV